MKTIVLILAGFFLISYDYKEEIIFIKELVYIYNKILYYKKMSILIFISLLKEVFILMLFLFLFVLVYYIILYFISKYF